MATTTPATIEDSWDNLRANPVFRRTLAPRGLRPWLRSPVVRAIGLTAVALALLWEFQRHITVWWPLIVGAVLFWFTVRAVQYAFCWLELQALASSGTLTDYLNSGLSRADVALGVIYPARVAEEVATLLILSWFFFRANDPWGQGLLGGIAALTIAGLLRPPALFLPDAEAYLRRRNPIALFFISVKVVVPLVLWFALFYVVLWAVQLTAVRLAPGMGVGPTLVLAFLATMFLFRWPVNWWNGWRLKQFYQRYESFDDLFERYIEQEDKGSVRAA